MAIKYIDFVNGNDASDGSTWALAWKSLTTGATAARIAPGDEIRIAKSPDPTSLGQTALWTGIDRIYTEITPTSSSNSTPIVITKAGHGIASGDIVQVYGHTVNTNANGKWKATYISDSQFSLDGSVGNGTGGGTGKFSVINHRAVLLTTAVTQDICNCDIAWTAGTNCTVTLETYYVKEGTGATKVVCGASSGSGQIVAKYALPSSIDLSMYEQVSFWLQNNAALAINNLEIRLYSDAACTTLVESLPMGAGIGYGRFRPMVIDKSSALPSSVRGIALYAVASQAGKTFYLDNIVACKASSAADSITHLSLISKNTKNANGDHAFLALQAISGNVLYLDNGYSTYNTLGMGYSGLTENVIIYKREGIVVDMASSAYQVMMDSGNTTSHIVVTGGWNKVSNERDGYTVCDGLNNLCSGLYFALRSFVDLSYVQMTRFNYGVDYCPGGGIHSNIIVTNCIYNIRLIPASYEDIYSLNGTNNGINTDPSSVIGIVKNMVGNNNIGYGISLSTSGLLDYTSLIGNNNLYGIQCSNYKYKIGSIIASFNRYTGVHFNSGSNGGVTIDRILQCNFNGYEGLNMKDNYTKIGLIDELNYNKIGIRYTGGNTEINKIIKANYNDNLISYDAGTYKNKIYEISESIGVGLPLMIGRPIEEYIYKAVFTNYSAGSTLTPVSIYFIDCAMEIQGVAGSIIVNGRIYHHNYNHSGNHMVVTEFGFIENENLIRHTASGMAWKVAITGIARTNLFPVNLSVAKVFCLAGSQAIMSCWIKKTHSTDIGARLIINHFINTTIVEDVATTAAETTEWQQLIITFIPTGDGVIEFELETFWQGNEADEIVYIDDVSVAQLI